MSRDSDMIMPEAFPTPPVSGSYEEYDFGDSAGRYWIKFTNSQYVEWCGKFGLGLKPGRRKILWFPNTREFFVLADGQGYVVDADKREVIARTRNNAIEDAVFIPNRRLVAVTDGLTIGLFDQTGDIWESKRIAYDGITFEQVKADRITGHLDDLTNKGCDFVFHVDERRVEAERGYVETASPVLVSQSRLAQVVVMTFGAALIVLGIAVFVAYRDPTDLGLTLLGSVFLLFGRYSIKKQRTHHQDS